MTAMSVSVSTPITVAGRPWIGGRRRGRVDELHVDLVGLVDDVVVGDDVAARIDDEAGAQRLALAPPSRRRRRHRLRPGRRRSG